MNQSSESNASSAHDYRLVGLTDPQRLAEFQELIAIELGIELPLEYVQRAESLALIDSRDRICGGAMLVATPPFRSLESIPDGLDDNPEWGEAGLSEYAEINGVWIAKDCRSPLTSIAYWILLLKHVLGCGQRKFVFTFDNSNERMVALTRWIKSFVVYSGRTRKLPGMKQEADETIAIIDHRSLQTFLEYLDLESAGVAKSGMSAFVDRLSSKRQVVN